MSNPYSGNKLPERHIRLLDLHPGEIGTPFRGTLRHACLDSAEFYEALSYTWGAPITSSYLRCGSGSVPLTLNLTQALARLRRTDRTRTLWIDQICINQDNNAERGQQVSLMGDIYRGAAIVNIWLGEEDEETTEAMVYLPHLLQAFSNPDERDDVGDEVPHVMQVLSILTVRSPGWIGLRNIFERPYFRRMWIVQEVALGKTSAVQLGSHTIAWDDLAKAALCLEGDGGHQVDAHRVVRMIKLLRRQTVLDQPGRRPLIRLLHQSFNLLCTNPRDKIYGVLGLATDIRPGELLPDYSLSCQEVYHAATIFCVNKYKSLEVLCQVRHPKSLPALPSWVPDWTVISSLGQSLGFNLSENYSASGKKVSAPQFHLSDDKHTLYSNGKFVDNIQQVGTVMPSEQDLIVNVYERYEVLLEWEQYARTFSPYATGESYPTTFWRLLLADGGTRWKDSDRTRQQFYESHQNLVERNRDLANKDWEPVAEMSIVNTRSLEFDKLMEAACYGRRIAITEQGFLGLVPADAQARDEICILESVKVPLVLRRVPLSGDHHLIGESYLQGWMDGSWFESSPNPNMQFSLI
ncbi:uncharacterized protein PAC_16420 [Phialocephala subalpina]|uniref:Heterokaryon incompatibility domain-containing protein n=1 Tax=Phialocephala subalpina TaxID=576137 RepID=A0A1L7XNA7_9HELO|nr:uncharacterized protein PAC_16420 [Phialocephala subalpina]